MAYGFNNDKSKAEVFTKNDFTGRIIDLSNYNDGIQSGRLYIYNIGSLTFFFGAFVKSTDGSAGMGFEIFAKGQWESAFSELATFRENWDETFEARQGGVVGYYGYDSDGGYHAPIDGTIATGGDPSSSRFALNPPSQNGVLKAGHYVIHGFFNKDMYF